MKKGLKIFVLVAGGFVLLAVIAITLAFTPAVQTWAVRKAVAGEPGTTFEVSRLAAGLSGAEIKDLHYAKDGVVVTAKGVSAAYSAMAFLTQDRIDADFVNIDDLTIDLRNATRPPDAATPATGSGPGSTSGTPDSASSPQPSRPAGAGHAEKKAPFEGLLQQAQLPFDIRLGRLAAKGRALLPDNQVVTFDLKGADIATGQRGKIDWSLDFANSTTGAALSGLRVDGGAAIRIATDRRIDLIEIETTAAAMGPSVSNQPIKLTAKAAKPAPAGDETYSAAIGLVRGNVLEPLLKTDARYAAASRDIAGSWDVAIRSEQLAGFLAGLGLPEIAANGAGKFSFKPDTGAVAASGELQAKATQLEKIMPELQAIGAVQFKTAFDGGMAEEVARLDKLNVEIAGADGRTFAQIASLQKVALRLADQRVTLADPKAELARISLQALPLAWAQAFAKDMKIASGDLSMALAVEAEPDGSRIRARAVEPLAVRELTIEQDGKKLADRVSVSLRPNIDYSAAKLSARLADLSVTTPAGDGLTGTLSAEVANPTTAPATDFSAQLQGKIVSLLKPYLPAETGPLALAITAEGRHEGQSLQVAKATATVNREGGALLAALELQQPMRVDLAASTVAAANPAAPAARVRLGEVPLSWAESFVAKSKLDGSLAGGVVEVTLRTVEDVTVSTTEPIALRGITAALDGKPLLQAVDLSANFTATKRGETIAYELRHLDAKQGQATLAALTASGEATLAPKLVVAAKGTLQADIPALTAQPALAQNATLARGRVAVAFDATHADATQAKAVISAKDLVAKQDNRALGDLELSLDANLKPDGSGRLRAPLTLTNASRKSDLTIDATFGKASDQKTFIVDGKIASDLLAVEDFQPLAGLVPAAEPAEKPKTPRTPKPTRDTEPFWKGVNGKLALDLKRVLYGKDYDIAPVRGVAVITDSEISLEGLEGKFKENPFKVAAAVTFAAQQPQPYSLVGSADVQNFDVGAFLRAGNPNELPALETKATLSAKLNGNGGTVGDLAKNAFGKFELTGSEGTMRVLAQKGKLAGAAVDILSTGLAILGARKNSDTTVALAELAQLLKEVRFDRVKMEIERGADLKFKLSSMEVLSPILRLTGSGTVATTDAAAVENAPMNILFQLGAKDELGFLLQRVNLLGANKDEKGYNLMSRTFTVGGTPAKPDSSSLWKILGEAALGLVR